MYFPFHRRGGLAPTTSMDVRVTRPALGVLEDFSSGYTAEGDTGKLTIEPRAFKVANHVNSTEDLACLADKGAGTFDTTVGWEHRFSVNISSLTAHNKGVGLAVYAVSSSTGFFDNWAGDGTADCIIIWCPMGATPGDAFLKSYRKTPGSIDSSDRVYIDADKWYYVKCVMDPTGGTHGIFYHFAYSSPTYSEESYVGGAGLALNADISGRYVGITSSSGGNPEGWYGTIANLSLGGRYW